MDMYQVAFPPPPMKELHLEGLCGMYRLTPSDFGALCDAWVETSSASATGMVIRFYARVGGHRSEAFADVYLKLLNHANFQCTRQDGEESSYISICFEVPPILPIERELHEKALDALRDIAIPPVDMKAAWEKGIGSAVFRLQTGQETADDRAMLSELRQGACNGS